MRIKQQTGFFYTWRVTLTSLGSVEFDFVKSSPKKNDDL